MRTVAVFFLFVVLAGLFWPARVCAHELSEEDARVIAEKYPNFQKTPSGLMYRVTAAGEGACPVLGSRVTVNYEARFLDGTKFDSSAERGPFTFTLGVGKVIKGWDEAFFGMKKGEKRTLVIPYWLGYGDKYRPPIPPRSTLVYDVELVSFH